MAITRIKSNASSFIQPPLGSSAAVVLDPGIDWIKTGILVHIPDGGVYKIESISGFVHQLKLETAIAAPGEIVRAALIFPVSEKGGETKWGGENGKEW